MSKEEGNKLIAEFMGDGHLAYPHGGQAKYHSSWDWLMPAWKKLYKKIWEMPPNVKIENHFHEMEPALSYWYSEMEQPLTKGLIDTAWKKLVEAIQWYTTQTPKV